MNKINNIFNKNEIENTLKDFKEGQDYSVSPTNEPNIKTYNFQLQGRLSLCIIYISYYDRIASAINCFALSMALHCFCNYCIEMFYKYCNSTVSDCY